MMRALLISVAVASYAANACAAVTIERHDLQKGYFVQAGCRASESKEDREEGYDACACDADISYPEISGLRDGAAQESLNAGFKRAAEQAQCKGTPAQKPKEAPAGQSPSPSSMSHTYEVTFQSPHVIGLEFTDGEYGGGAHGDRAVTGVIIDMDKALTLAPADLISAQDVPAVNQMVYDTLSAKPEGDVLHDQIESHKGAFLKDGQCSGCTLTLTPAGVNIVFQTYEVAPYSSGNVTVTLPVKFISYPAVVQALSEQPATTPVEKK